MKKRPVTLKQVRLSVVHEIGKTRMRLLEREPASAAERRERAALEAEIREREYARQVDDARLGFIGKRGKEARKFQGIVYSALGLDPKAGYDGAPPAFLVDKEVNSASAITGTGFRNAVRDPLALLHRKNIIDAGQYQAANDFIALWEAYSSIGGRAINYGERVDGGRAPDVSDKAMAIVSKVDAFRAHMGYTRLALLTAACLERMSMDAIAETEMFGRDYRTVLRKLRAALDHAARFF